MVQELGEVPYKYIFTKKSNSPKAFEKVASDWQCTKEHKVTFFVLQMNYFWLNLKTKLPIFSAYTKSLQFITST